jgi:hypothetical protein
MRRLGIGIAVLFGLLCIGNANAGPVQCIGENDNFIPISADLEKILPFMDFVPRTDAEREIFSTYTTKFNNYMRPVLSKFNDFVNNYKFTINATMFNDQAIQSGTQSTKQGLPANPSFASGPIETYLNDDSGTMGRLFNTSFADVPNDQLLFHYFMEQFRNLQPVKDVMKVSQEVYDHFSKNNDSTMTIAEYFNKNVYYLNKLAKYIKRGLIPSGTGSCFPGNFVKIVTLNCNFIPSLNRKPADFGVNPVRPTGWCGGTGSRTGDYSGFANLQTAMKHAVDLIQNMANGTTFTAYDPFNSAYTGVSGVETTLPTTETQKTLATKLRGEANTNFQPVQNLFNNLNQSITADFAPSSSRRLLATSTQTLESSARLFCAQTTLTAAQQATCAAGIADLDALKTALATINTALAADPFSISTAQWATYNTMSQNIGTIVARFNDQTSFGGIITLMSSSNIPAYQAAGASLVTVISQAEASNLPLTVVATTSTMNIGVGVALFFASFLVVVPLATSGSIW